MHELSIKKGKELTELELKVINDFRKQEFNSPTLQQLGGYEEHLFFLLKQAAEILAFGRLKNINVEVEGVQYPIWGIAMIIATHKGQGYGRELINRMKQYILKNGLTAFGFCNQQLSSFYAKSGYLVIKGGGNRFLHRQDSEIIPNTRLNDVIYLDGTDMLGSKVATDQNLIVYTPCPQW